MYELELELTKAVDLGLVEMLEEIMNSVGLMMKNLFVRKNVVLQMRSEDPALTHRRCRDQNYAIC